MSTTTARKPPPPGTPGRDTPTKASSSPGAGRRTSTTPSATATNPGVTRTRSVRSGVNGTPVSARAAVRKPGASSSLSMTSSQVDGPDDDARDEAAAYMADLKERLQKAESSADERQKQIEVLHSRLDDALKEQSKLEERAHEEEEKVESLENEKRDITRQQRELEAIYEAERAQSMKEKEATQAREDDLQMTIQRLKETMATKNVASSDGEGDLSRSSSFRKGPSRTSSSQNVETAGSFAPPSSIQRSDSRNHSKLIHQKDKIIEGLRLELAEVQIKLVEMENAGGGRMRDLEKQLMETRMTNARLMEENESFQVLLGEKTLNGDLSRGDFLRPSSSHEERAPSRSGPLNSLADELESAEGVEGEVMRKLEGEVNNLKDQNKALTLYINKIIGRLLTHQGFESVLGNDLDEATGGNTSPNINKELPPPPPPKENEQPAQGFLQRAKSVAMGAGRKPRPMSYAAPQASLNEDPSTAPSIPLQRGQSQRTTSDQFHRRSTSEVPGAANVVTNMFRAPPSAATPGQISPGLVSPRNSFFGIPISNNSNPTSRVPSTGPPIKEEKDEKEDAKSTSETSHVDTPSPPRRSETTTMGGKQMRPLRLVQNEEDAMRARKAANRGSWFGGLFGAANPNAEQKPQSQDPL